MDYCKWQPSGHLVEVISKMLEVNPKNRYATAHEAIQDIDRLFAAQRLLSPTVQYTDQMQFSGALEQDLGRVRQESEGKLLT